MRNNRDVALRIATIVTLNTPVALVAWTPNGGRSAARFQGKAGARRLNMALGVVLPAVWAEGGPLVTDL